MSRKDKIDRYPIPENMARAYMGTAWTMIKAFGIDKFPAAIHYFQLHCEEIERGIFEQNNPAVTRHKETGELRRYIAIFKARYLELSDSEYKNAISPVEGKMISQLCGNLQESGFTVDEYLKWIFEEFLPTADKFCPPQLKWTCCAFIVNKFMYVNKELKKERKESEVRSKMSSDLINSARVCMRKATKPEDVEKIKEMSIEDFRDIEHFNFGQWIRNKYFYQNPAQEQLIKSLGGLEKNFMLLDSDRFSHIILDALWKKSKLKTNNNPEIGSPVW
jgi:hypothetical protein